MELMRKYNYNLKEIMKLIFLENPDITKQDCYEKAKLLKKEIDNSNREINRNTAKYFEKNSPLSTSQYHNNTVYSIHDEDEET